jgi:hypothetical protein
MQTLEKPRIPGIESPPPDREAYAFGAPEGVWTARLDYLQWGRKANNVPNLLCYFTDVETGKRYFFSAFKSDGYGPLDRSLRFREERLGTLYRLTTGRNSRGNPVWRAAVRLECADETPVVAS